LARARIRNTLNRPEQELSMVAAEVHDDRITGEWQQPINLWQEAENSIHNDAVAKKVGMRGGTIPGTIHLSHFRPILTKLFGDRWFRTGSISMFYTFATVDREEVRAIVKKPAAGATDVQLDAWVEDKEGRVVCKGTVAVGRPAAKSYVRSLELKDAAPGTTRILREMKPGQEIPRRENYIVKESGEDGLLLDPQLVHRALTVFPADVVTAPAVGFYGATELVFHDGPVRTGVPYSKSGKVVCVGVSPKTEFAWFDSFLRDREGKLVAEMRHMTRWMKISSPRWAA
jgi:hypothetical protein